MLKEFLNFLNPTKWITKASPQSRILRSSVMCNTNKTSKWQQYVSTGHRNGVWVRATGLLFICVNRASHYLGNMQRVSGRINDVSDIAQTVAASYSFILACILLSSLLLILWIHSYRYLMDINAKIIFITDLSSSSSCMLFPGTTHCQNKTE